MDFTNRSILRLAMEQSAIDAHCSPEDFAREENVVVTSVPDPRARKYLTLPFDCHLISYGSNIVASVSEPFREAAAGYIRRFPVEHCFETPALHVLEDAVREQGAKVCFMAEYFLPDLGALRPLDSPYPLKMLGPADFGPLYTGTWSNALCKDRRELDVLGIGAYDGGELAGFAACSADCEGMWQIGVDVLPAYRRQGIASALTSRLALAILERGKVPFYCAAWSNLRSVRSAIKSGFRPAWVELTVKSAAFVDRMNGAQ